VDVTPNGQYMVVAGKLDPHVTVYSIEKIKKAIAEKAYSGTDEYGVPVLDFDAVKEAQVELGLGPLHTQFDDKGYAYTSLFLDSAVARWSLGGEYDALHDDRPWKLVQKTPVQYNIGHLCAAEGDTVSPDGNYLISMSKWSRRPLPADGPAAAAELPAARHRAARDDDAGDLRQPDRRGRAALLPDDQGRQAQDVEGLPRGRLEPAHAEARPERAQEGRQGGRHREGNKRARQHDGDVRSHFTPEHVESRGR
jgi:nitrous-oxide reductase